MGNMENVSKSKVNYTPVDQVFIGYCTISVIDKKDLHQPVNKENIVLELDILINIKILWSVYS